MACIRSASLLLMAMIASRNAFALTQQNFDSALGDDGQWVMSAKNHDATVFYKLANGNKGGGRQLHVAWTFST